jgi:hypothetical protein
LLKLFLTHRLTGVDQNVPDAELFNKTQRLFARSRADGHHADDRADAEHDAERGEQRARLLRAEIAESLDNVGEYDHFCNAFITPAAGFADFCCSGFDIATSRPSSIPVMTAWLSLRRTNFTSCGVNAPSGERT